MRTCEWPPCGKPLDGMRDDARYCGDTCSKAARRALARIQKLARAARESASPESAKAWAAYRDGVRRAAASQSGRNERQAS